MARPILLDTDVLVDFLRGDKQAVAYVTKNEDRIALSSIVVAELYAGARGKDEERQLGDFVRHLRVIPITQQVARRGGLLKRDYASSHGVGLADALLAATAEEEGAELATLNTRHYPMIKGLGPAYRKAAR